MSKRYDRLDGFKVCVVSQDDGHNVVDSYFTDHKLASERARKIKGNVLSQDLYTSEYGNTYLLTTTEIFTDVPDKKDVLCKLTRVEKYALGIKD